MDWTTTLLVVCAIYGVLLFFDMFFKSCAHAPYISLLRGTGLRIQFFQIRWNTSAFNRFFLRWGNNAKLNVWFTCGMYITLIILPISVLMLFMAMYQNFTSNRQPGKAIIEPVLPGINLPTSEIWFYSTSLILSSIIHELGHALASVKEDVHIINTGIRLFFILPIAYVSLSSECLNSINPWKALRIFCAGIWHNLVLSLLAYLLYTSLPYFYSILFLTNQGVFVNFIKDNSPLAGPRGLQLNNIITGINDCTVRNEEQLYDCLQHVYLERQGYCVDSDTVHNLDESIPLRYTNYGFDCCDASKTESICFEYLEKNDGVLEMPPHACLPARTVVESSKSSCSTNRACAFKLHCIRPLLDNSTGLFRFIRANQADIIYIGHPGDFAQTIKVSPYIPKYVFSQLFIPDIVMKFLEYLIVLSTGLALVNVIPCLFMDGQHITNYVIQIICKDKSIESCKIIATLISILSTSLLLLHCIYSVWLRY